jgi:hypothetical protein
MADPHPLWVEIIEGRKMEEDIVAKMLATDEPELAVGDQGDDLADAHY